MCLPLSRCFASAIACALWLASAGLAFGQEGERCCAVTRLDFSADAPQLTTTAAVEEWVRSELAEKLGLSQSDQLEVGDAPRSLNGHPIYTLTQSVGGLPVAHRESRLVLDRDRRVLQLLGNHSRFPTPQQAELSITLERAFASAGVIESDMSDGQLVFWPDGGDLRLAYEIEGAAAGHGRAAFERIYVDTSDGSVLERISLTPRAFDAAVYDFAAACREGRVRRRITVSRFAQVARRAMTNHARTLGSRPGTPDAERMFGYLREIHRLLNSTLELDSFDGRGGQLRGFVGVRFGSTSIIPQCVGDESNAFWHGGLKAVFMPTAALDYTEIIGHEFGHGIVEAGSNLLMRNQSGALNESISDALGVAFHAWIESGASGTSQLPSSPHEREWQVRLGGRTIRDFSAPATLRVEGTSRPYPDHYRDYWYVLDDEGGVHTNSSIMNHAFYLLVEGGQHRRLRSGPSVQGVGLSKALKVFGRAATDLLTRNSSFEAARYAFATVAELLYGRSSPEWVATHTAMDAVGIPGYWDRPKPPPVPIPKPKPPNPPEPEQRSEPEPEREELSDARTEEPEPRLPPPPERKQPREREPPQPREPRSEYPPRTPQERDSDKLEPRPPPRPVEVSSIPASWPFYFLLAILALAAIGYALARLRPGEREFGSGRPLGRGANASGRAHGSHRAGPDPPVPVHASVGSLVPQDTSLPPIELRTDLLTSPEGLVVGRSSRLSHVQILDERVSRQHLRLRLVNGAIWVEDLSSTRGTYVQGQPATPLQPVRLGTDSVLQIADFAYRIRLN